MELFEETIKLKYVRREPKQMHRRLIETQPVDAEPWPDHLGDRAVLRAVVPGAEMDGRCFRSNEQSENQKRHVDFCTKSPGDVLTLEPAIESQKKSGVSHQMSPYARSTTLSLYVSPAESIKLKYIIPKSKLCFPIASKNTLGGCAFSKKSFLAIGNGQGCK